MKRISLITAALASLLIGTRGAATVSSQSTAAPSGQCDGQHVLSTSPRRKWSIALGVVLYIVATFIFIRLIVEPLLIQAGVISSSEVLGWASGNYTAWAFWLIDASNILAVILIVAAVLGFYKEPLSSLGLTTHKVPRAVLYGMAGFVVAYVGELIVDYPLVQRFGVDPTQHALTSTAAAPELLAVVFISGAIIVPICEEIVFRGYLYKAFRDRFKPWYAILLSAAFFSAIHFEPLAALGIFVIGIVLAYVYEKTGNLLAPITLHVINNAFLFLLSFLIAR